MKSLPEGWITNTLLYKELLAERDEILGHKWLESEKAGYAYPRLGPESSATSISPTRFSAINPPSRARFKK